MELPNAVKKAAERSENLQKELQHGKTPQSQDGITAPATPAPGARDTLPQQTPSQQQDTPPKANDDTWEAKYKSLKGKFDAENPMLKTMVRDLQRNESELKQRIEQLERALQETKKEPEPQLDPQRFEAYGTEFGELVKVIEQQKKTLQEQSSKMAQLTAQLNGTSSRLDEVAIDQEAERKKNYQTYINNVARELKARGQDYNRLNYDEGFINWLRQHDQGDKYPRFSYLNQAEANHDLEATMAIFDRYLTGNTTPQAQRQQTFPNVQPQSVNTGVDFNPPNQQQQVSEWKKSEITKFYTDKAAGKYDGREAEADRLEMEIFAASKAGRIRSG